MSRLMTLLCGLLLTGSAWAADELISDVRYTEGNGFAHAGILLGMPVEVTAMAVDPDGALRIRLAATAVTGSPGWSGVELGFAESQQLIARIALEGSDRQGYELVVGFSGAVDAELIPPPIPGWSCSG